MRAIVDSQTVFIRFISLIFQRELWHFYHFYIFFLCVFVLLRLAGFSFPSGGSAFIRLF